jgi:cytochrome-b5 reductase
MNAYIGFLQVAGGSGLTPMLQVIDAIVSNPEDNTQVH